MPFTDTIFGVPKISREAFVDPDAFLIGDVRIDDFVLVAAKASLRADEGSPFRVRSGCNVQDTVVFHGHKNQYVHVDGEKYSVYVDERTTMAHRALIHGPAFIGKEVFVGANTIVWGSTVGDQTFIKHGARVINAKIGKRCIVGTGAIVENVSIPDGMYIHSGVVVNRPSDLARWGRFWFNPKVEKAHEKEFLRCREVAGEILEVNHELVEKHRRRAAALMVSEMSEKLHRWMDEKNLRIDELRKNPQLRDNPPLLAATIILVETLCKTKAERVNGGASATGNEQPFQAPQQ